MDTKSLDNLISQLHAAAALASGSSAKPAALPESGSQFGDLLKSSLDRVNGTQQEAEQLARSFEVGAPGTSLHDVMISASKANIAFQATVQVRNRLVSAYNDIMNLQI